MMFESSEQISGKSIQSSEAVTNPAFDISAEIVDKLLDKLSSDDEFRSVFLRSPRIALAYLGHEAATNANVSDEGAWRCMACTNLADADVIKNTRNELRNQLITIQGKYNPISLQTKG